MKRPDLITIAGAGLVGSLLGVMLGKRGYRVQIFERRADMRGQDVAVGRSINLALAERGIHSLKKAGLMSAVEPLLIPMRGRMLHDLAGNTEFQSYGQRPHEVIYSVSRGGLNELMLTAAEESKQVEIYFEHELDSIDFATNTIHFTNASNGIGCRSDADANWSRRCGLACATFSFAVCERAGSLGVTRSRLQGTDDPSGGKRPASN